MRRSYSHSHGDYHHWLPQLFQRGHESSGKAEDHDNPSERDPLLRNGASDPDLEDGKTQGSEKGNVLQEFQILIKGSIPVILAYTLQMSLQTLSVVIVGHSSADNLATAAFGYMFAMCTAWLIALGGTTAIDTIASASFTGSKDPHDLGIVLQRAFVVLSSFYVPVVILWIFAEPLFLALGQDARLSRDTARFLWCLIPGGLGYIYFECMKKFLQAQEIMRPGTYTLLLTSPLNCLLNYLFIYPFKLGLYGAPLATGLSYWLSFLLLVLYTRFTPKALTHWGGFSRRSFSKLGTFARLAILGVLHVGSEWWAFEIVALAAGRLGKIPLAAQSVIMTADQVMNTIPFGVGIAASARIGNLLGASDARGAKRAANTAAWLSMFLGLVVLIVLMASKEHFAKIFNDEESVVHLTAKTLPWVALFQIADGLNGSCGGSLRGMGRQHVGAAVNVVSYYCGALPLGIWLAFHGWGLPGLWVGQCIALYIVGILEWGIVIFSNWDKEVEKALKRLDKEDQEQGDGDGEAPPAAGGEDNHQERENGSAG